MPRFPVLQTGGDDDGVCLRGLGLHGIVYNKHYYEYDFAMWLRDTVKKRIVVNKGGRQDTTR